MATIKEMFDGLKVNFTADKREYTATYIVDGVWTTSTFPSYLRWDCKGLVDTYARLTGLGTSRQLSKDVSEVEANYTTLPAGHAAKASTIDQPANPLSRSVKRRWSTGYVEMYPPKDLDDKKFCVSTGEPIRGGVPVKIPYLVKHYVRNEAYFPESTALAMIWAMDSTKKILCAKFDGSEQLVDNGVNFVEVSYEFWCLGGSDTWEEKRLDAGSYYLEENDDEEMVPKYLEDDDGVKAYADGAVLLDGAGGKLAAEAEAQWQTFRVNKTASFASLGLPGI